MRTTKLKLNPGKCNLACPEVPFLGLVVSSDGIPGLTLLDTIVSVSPPTTARHVMSFLGLVGYYCRFVRELSKISAPLHQLLHRDSCWEWTPKYQQVFETLKQKPHPPFVTAFSNFNVLFHLYAYTASENLGAVLAHFQDGEECLLCCTSYTLNPVKWNYGTSKKECLTVVMGCVL